MNKTITITTKYNYPFKRYLRRILSVIPDVHLSGITYISVGDQFSYRDKKANESLASYTKDNKGKSGKIELHLGNMIQKKIPDYMFSRYPEIAALFLSEVVGHEIGHHVQHHYKHGIRKNDFDVFSDKYAQTVYLKYFESRYYPILFSYWMAGANLFLFDKSQRQQIRKTKKELITWYNLNRANVDFSNFL